MATTASLVTPGLDTYLKLLKQRELEYSIESLVSLLKRRQIRGSRPCATATARLMMQVVRRFKSKDVNALIERVKSVGTLLTLAQPREIAVGNIVRRVLGVIREEADEDRAADVVSEATSGSGSQSPWNQSAPLRSVDLAKALGMGTTDSLVTSEAASRPPFFSSQTSYQISVSGSAASMFDLLSASQSTTPGTQSPTHNGSPRPAFNAGPTSSVLGLHKDIKGEVMQGIEEIIDELNEADDQIAAYAPEHIHSAETILIHGASGTVQKFLLRAATKRKFTVIHVESFPNNHPESYSTATGKRFRAETGSQDIKLDEDEDNLEPEAFAKPLIAAGITVVLIPDSAVFALMARVNKVVLGTHVVLANGGLVAASGTRVVAQAAHAHRTPVIVATGVYKLSPLYPFDIEMLVEHGDASAVLDFANGGLVDCLDVANPLFDYVPPDLVDLYVTNLGGHAPSYLYRIVADHYRKEDSDLA